MEWQIQRDGKTTPVLEKHFNGLSYCSPFRSYCYVLSDTNSAEVAFRSLKPQVLMQKRQNVSRVRAIFTRVWRSTDQFNLSACSKNCCMWKKVTPLF